jgi:hypothetical protein
MHVVSSFTDVKISEVKSAVKCITSFGSGNDVDPDVGVNCVITYCLSEGRKDVIYKTANISCEI